MEAAGEKSEQSQHAAKANQVGQPQNRPLHLQNAHPRIGDYTSEWIVSGWTNLELECVRF